MHIVNVFQNKAREEMNKLVIDPKASKPLGVKIHTKKIVGKEEFKCRAEDLYRALTDVQVKRYRQESVLTVIQYSEGFLCTMHTNVYKVPMYVMCIVLSFF